MCLCNFFIGKLMGIGNIINRINMFLNVIF